MWGAIQIGKMDLINKRYQSIVFSMLKNKSRRYYNHYIIKFIGFISIYYVINLDIILYYIIVSYLYKV